MANAPSSQRARLGGGGGFVEGGIIIYFFLDGLRLDDRTGLGASGCSLGGVGVEESPASELELEGPYFTPTVPGPE